MKNEHKSGKYSKRGDKLEVKLRDHSYNPLLEKEVAVNNLRELGQLLTDLKDKGVPIDKAIDYSIENLNWW